VSNIADALHCCISVLSCNEMVQYGSRIVDENWILVRLYVGTGPSNFVGCQYPCSPVFIYEYLIHLSNLRRTCLLCSSSNYL
jgi:hypothetical protein